LIDSLIHSSSIHPSIHPSINRSIDRSIHSFIHDGGDAEKTVLLVMEFVSNGCLRDYLKKNNKTNPDELLRFGFEVVEVLSHFTCKQCICRNLSHNVH